MANQPSKKAQKSPQSTASGANSDKLPVIDAIPAEVHDGAPVSADPAPSPAQAVPQTPQASPAPKPHPVAEPQKRATGFVPLLLGGVIAGAIGFGVASVTRPAADTSQADAFATQATEIDSLRAQIAAIPSVDLTDITLKQNELSDAIIALETEMAHVVDALAARVEVIENQPRVVGEGAAPATAAYQAELDALRAQISEMTDIAQTQLATARAEAAAIEENAALAARNAAGRVALSRVQSGLETGAPLGAALGDLEAALEQSAPEGLLAVQDGVPTLQELRETYADAARAALATARAEGVSGESTSGFGAFIRDQLDVRSTSPREGDDADAVLSRAGAAINAGRLADALAEIDALPEVVRAEMSEWRARADLRAAALAAVELLSTTLSDN
ncbi:hypothetical protein SAMN04488005_2812 [Yoonia tamlensis]|uniref:Inner membrane protein n=1 Tax=Yoonia tamlensis TaxID=390270 RepID=A0A1I6HKT8_9RHOB|nr:hypothetical protein [Yoonia tamlensis]SFR55071.1 hypothetical protein SAMN04488005_2812 [Yoonia tamlensis]